MMRDAVIESFKSPGGAPVAGPSIRFRWAPDVFDFQPFSAGEFVSALSPGQPELLGLYAEPEGWSGKIILNVADSTRFSSDRTIAECAVEIWDTKPCLVPYQ